jgi:trehalose/maltose hydrolase-like predicted phosphorylase
VDIIQRSYTGLETSGDILRFNPSLPRGLKSAQFMIKYRRHRLNVRITERQLKVGSEPLDAAPIRIGFREGEFVLKPGNTLEFELQ